MWEVQPTGRRVDWPTAGIALSPIVAGCWTAGKGAGCEAGGSDLRGRRRSRRSRTKNLLERARNSESTFRKKTPQRLFESILVQHKASNLACYHHQFDLGSVIRFTESTWQR